MHIYCVESSLIRSSLPSLLIPPSPPLVPISSIKEVREGRSTETFKAVTSRTIPPENVCFSIIYTVGNKFRNLDLAAYTESDKKAWVSGIRALLKSKGNECAVNPQYSRQICATQ